MSTKKPTKLKNKVRLPDGVIPKEYDLLIHTDLEGFLFNGEERIYIEIKKPQKVLVLHAHELLINKDKVQLNKGKQSFNLKSLSFDDKNETVTFDFGVNLVVGKYTLDLAFEGKLADNLRGYYRAKYLHEGKESWLATTQFEATDARKAFPCFDEPAMKAVFNVSLAIPKSLTAISNTHVTEVLEHQGGYQIMKFAPTPKMSTYLLAYIVGDFEFIESKTKSGVRVRVYTTPGKKSQGEFALDCAARTIDYFDQFFGIPYPLETMDLIGIPDFAAGAMENWGAVTYRESQLLVDPENSSVHTKQWVALTVAHELAHQWFGNLVTMHWWTHLWLNEGFASYIEYVAVDHLFPDWRIWEQFVSIDFNSALELDSLDSTHPIEIEVHHPSEIGEIFDSVSYHKGASVIRMLADYLGFEKFRKGLSSYLKTHSYSNASTEDLWKAFEKSSGKPVRQIMKTWTSKAGYPRVQVIESKKGIKLYQQRFYSSSVIQKQHKDSTVWKVPLTIKLPNGTEKKILFDKKSQVFDINPAMGSKINFGQTSVVRVDYPKNLLFGLSEEIGKKNVSAVDRLGLLGDAFAVSENGNLPLTLALDLIASYKDEDDYIVLTELIENLLKVSRVFSEFEFYPKLETYARDLLAEKTSQVGFTPAKGESHHVSLLRPVLVSSSGHFGNTDCIEWARKSFASGKVHPDLRGAAYQLTAKYGGKSEYESFVKSYINSTSSEERNRVGRALGAFKQPELIKKTLKFSLSKEVKVQDTPTLLMGVWANFNGRELAWQFIQDNLDELIKRYGHGGHTFSRIISPIGLFTDKSKASEVKKFFKTHKAPGAERTVTQVIEQIESSSAWKSREAKNLAKFFAK